MHDVVVIGAGPAGLLAARTLARAGRDVLVLEEHAAVGYPVHCTGVLGLEAFEELELPRETIYHISRGARFFAATGRSVLVESDRVRAAVVDRGAFDGALARQAVAAGATLLTGVRVHRLEVTNDRVRADVAPPHGPAEGRACVLACGANYRFNRTLGLGIPRAFLQSAQVEVGYPTIEHVEVHFGRTIAPAGFAWLVPFQRGETSCVRLGLMCETHAARRFRDLVDRLGQRDSVDPGTIPPPRLKILPLAPVARTYTTRVLAVGDTAGLVKPTTGGGIYYSALSGRLAGEVLDGALGRDALDETSLRTYELRWRERLGPEIRAGLAFRKLAARLTDRAIEALVELARVDGLTPLLKETADFNWHRTAALAILRHSSFRRIVLSSLWG